MNERTVLATWRKFLAFLGATIVSATALSMVHYIGKGDEVLGFRVVMGVFGVIGTLCFFLTFALVRENNLQEGGKSVSLREAVGSLAVNTPWKLFALNIMFMWTGFFIQSAALIYYYKYYVGSTYLTSLVATILRSSPASRTRDHLAGRQEHKRNHGRSVHLSGRLRREGEYLFLDAGRPRRLWRVEDGRSGSGTSFLSKWILGQGCSGSRRRTAYACCATGGMLLAWGAYNAEAATQTPEALTAIKAMYLYIPMVLLVCSIITMSFYKLDEQFPQIQADLAKRRGK